MQYSLYCGVSTRKIDVNLKSTLITTHNSLIILRTSAKNIFLCIPYKICVFCYFHVIFRSCKKIVIYWIIPNIISLPARVIQTLLAQRIKANFFFINCETNQDNIFLCDIKNKYTYWSKITHSLFAQLYFYNKIK